MTQATCPQEPSLRIVTPDGDSTGRPELFGDNIDHIQFLAAEARLWIAEACLRLKNIRTFTSNSEEISFLRLPEHINDTAALRQLIDETGRRRAGMEEKSLARGVTLRFRELTDTYRLNDFEQRILQLLLAVETSLEVRSILGQCNIDFWNNHFRSREMEVGVILSILCPDYRAQLAQRVCFSVDRPLVMHEIIIMSARHQPLLENDVELHERISRFCLDDQNVYDTELRCITTEHPTVSFDRVILAERLKDDLLRYSRAFLDNSDREGRLRESFGYGAGLTCLFYGLSGTGKTMLAHGLANRLGCALLSLNIGSLTREDLSFEDAIKHIFREARLTGGIVFLDECDDLLSDNTRMSRAFLIEVEKAECITILATNKTVEMDPALDRRISLKIPFSLPDAARRKKIWQALLPDGMRFDDDVDLDQLATRYRFTGGLIKNTMLMAAGKTLARGKEKEGKQEDLVLRAAEIRKAAEYQAKSMFDLNELGKMSTPTTRLRDLALRRADRDRLKRLAGMVREQQQNPQGLAGLLTSTDLRTGLRVVEALAGENGLALRHFNLDTLFDFSSSPISASLRDIFKQKPVTIMEYVFIRRPGQQEILLLEDTSHTLRDFLIQGEKADSSSAWQKLKGMLRDYRGTVFVVTRPVEPESVPLEFACHLSLDFPTEDAQMGRWQALFPELAETEIMAIVEQFPMQVREIDLVARQVRTMARLNGFTGTDTDDIRTMAGRLRGISTTPLLFGNR